MTTAERRQTRSKIAKVPKEDDGCTEVKRDQSQLYIIPQTKAEACLSKETMLAVVDKAKHKAHMLALEAKREMERQLDQVLYY